MFATTIDPVAVLSQGRGFVALTGLPLYLNWKPIMFDSPVPFAWSALTRVMLVIEGELVPRVPTVRNSSVIKPCDPDVMVMFPVMRGTPPLFPHGPRQPTVPVVKA